MTRVRINGCFEEGCTRPGGHSPLCDEHKADYQPLACRGCGSTRTRSELDAGGWINCCPERAMNEVIEQRHGIPALTPGGIDPTLSKDISA